MIRLTVRATDDTVAPVLAKLMHERLAIGMSGLRQPVATTEDGLSHAFANVMVT